MRGYQRVNRSSFYRRPGLRQLPVRRSGGLGSVARIAGVLGGGFVLLLVLGAGVVAAETVFGGRRR